MHAWYILVVESPVSFVLCFHVKSSHLCDKVRSCRKMCPVEITASKNVNESVVTLVPISVNLKTKLVL